MKRNLYFRIALALAVAATSLAACGKGSGGGPGRATIGLPTVLSGPFAEFGQGAQRGVNDAVEEINKQGGLLGKKIDVATEDDAANVPAALTNSRGMITGGTHAVALFGASSSATAAAEAALAAQYKVPLLLWGGNDISLTTTGFTPYTFQLQPSTYMEPLAFAQYMSKLPYTRYSFIAPDYSFGHHTVESFVASMKALGKPVDTAGTSYVKLGLTDYSSYISAALANHPQVIFLAIFGGDLVTFIKQAKSYGLFSKVKVAAPTGTDTLTALGPATPAGMILSDRAPFFAISDPAAKQYAQRYNAQYHGWPTEWALLGYSAVQAWAQAVKSAGSFDGAKVSNALSGAQVHSVRGGFMMRPCDHQAVVPDYYGTVADTVDPKYGFPILTNVFTSDPTTTLMSCEAAQALQKH